MKKETDSNKSESQALIFSTAVTSVILALSVFVGIVAVVVTKIHRNKKYYEKWKDYDECGLS
jgi:hypothetical protein